jgi:hypothetical protein
MNGLELHASNIDALFNVRVLFLFFLLLGVYKIYIGICIIYLNIVNFLDLTHEPVSWLELSN